MKLFFYHNQESSNRTAGAATGDATAPQKRTCRYYLSQTGTREFLGETLVPCDMDIDDAFPPFHRKVFSDADYDLHMARIRQGAILTAESDFDGEKSMLAYTIGDPGYWYGRQSTLEYFGVHFKGAV